MSLGNQRNVDDAALENWDDVIVISSDDDEADANEPIPAPVEDADVEVVVERYSKTDLPEMEKKNFINNRERLHSHWQQILGTPRHVDWAIHSHTLRQAPFCARKGSLHICAEHVTSYM
ncbi:hypothetical protein Tco_0921667 [Tanacetum coccineum]